MEEEDKEEAHTDRQPRQHHKVQQAEQQREAHDYKHQINQTPNQSQGWQDYAQKEPSKTRYKPTFQSSRKASW